MPLTAVKITGPAFRGIETESGINNAMIMRYATPVIVSRALYQRYPTVVWAVFRGVMQPREPSHSAPGTPFVRAKAKLIRRRVA